MNEQVTCAECQQLVDRENTIEYGDTLICARCKPVFVQRLREGLVQLAATPYAGFWIRCCASLIDDIILLAITYPLLIAVYGWEYFTDAGFFAGAIDVLLSWICPAVATLLFWVNFQATPGKMLFRLRIVDARTNLAPSLTQFIIRYVMYFACLLPLALGFIWVAFDPRKEGWHDKAAGTIVVKTRKPFVQP